MEQLGTSDGKPTKPIEIVDCDEVSTAKGQHAVEKEKGTFDIKYEKILTSIL